MKKIYLLLSVIIVFLLASCSNNEIIDGQQVNNETITISATVTLPERERVVGLPDDPNADGWYDYEWDSNKKQKVYVLFQSGAMKDTSSVEFSVPTGYHPKNNPLKIEFKVKKPANFANIHNYQVSGAMGIYEMDNTGKCTITPPTTIDGNNQDYNLPFYFPITEVKNNSAKINFKTYGSLLRIVFTPNPEESITTTWSSIELKTSVISIQGSFNVNTSSLPEWTHDNTFESTEQVTNTTSYTYKTKKTYSLQNVSAAPGSKAVAYIWGFPLPLGTDAAGMDHDIYLLKNTSPSFIYLTTTKAAWENGKTYTMFANYKKPDLFISEFYHHTVTQTYFEIYNSTSAPVSLDGYYLYDANRGLWVNLITEVETTVPAGTTLNTVSAGDVVVVGTHLTKNYYNAVIGNEKDVWHNSIIRNRLQIVESKEAWGQVPEFGRYYLVYRPTAGNNIIVDGFENRGAISALAGMKRKSTINAPNPFNGGYHGSSAEWDRYYEPWFNADLGAR